MGEEGLCPPLLRHALSSGLTCVSMGNESFFFVFGDTKNILPFRHRETKLQKTKLKTKLQKTESLSIDAARGRLHKDDA